MEDKFDLEGLDGRVAAYIAKEDYSTAIQELVHARDVYASLDDSEKLGPVLEQLSELYKKQGDVLNSLLHSIEAKEVKGESTEDSEKREKSGSGMFASMAHQYGAEGMAEYFYYKDLKASRAQGKKKMVAGILNNLSAIYCNRGEHDRALPMLEEASELANELGDTDLQGSLLVNLGGIYHGKGQHEKAIGYLNQALDLNRAHNDKAAEAKALYNIGTIFYGNGDYAQGKHYLEEHCAIWRELGNQEELFRGLLTLVNIATHANDPETYLKAQGEAWPIAEMNCSPKEVFAMGTQYGHALCINGRPEEGLEILGRMLTLGKANNLEAVGTVEAIIATFGGLSGEGANGGE